MRRRRIGHRGSAAHKRRGQKSEAELALEQELQGVERALMDAVFRDDVKALEARRAEILGEMKMLRK